MVDMPKTHILGINRPNIFARGAAPHPANEIPDTEPQPPDSGHGVNRSIHTHFTAQSAVQDGNSPAPDFP